MVSTTTPKVVCYCGHIGKPVPGLGDLVAAVLYRVGMTPARYRRLKAALGFAPACRCHQRQHTLNRIGRWIRRLLQRRHDRPEAAEQ